MADKIGTDEYGEILIYQTDDGQRSEEHTPSRTGTVRR